MTDERITVYCAWPNCGASSWGATQAIFDEHTGDGGDSLVARTVAGLWACRPHAYAVGGGWARA